MPLHVSKHYTELIRQGRLAEEEGETEKAVELYELAIRQKPLEEFPYNRLLILYRRAGQSKAELKVVTKGLQVFTDHYDEKPKKLLNKDPRIARASKALFHALNGRKTPEAYYPEPIPKWMKRKEVMETKLGKT